MRAIKCIVCILAAVATMFVANQSPEMKSQYSEVRTPLPVQYRLVELQNTNELESLIESTYGKDVLVENVASLEVYQKLFSENHEHVLCIGARSVGYEFKIAGLMTMDRGVLWVYNRSYLENTTFSVKGGTLIANSTLEPWIAAQVVGYLVLPLLAILFCVVSWDIFRLYLPPMLRWFSRSRVMVVA